MRLYYFTSYEFAINDIKEKRIKISLLKDVNDPYEVSALKVSRKNRKELIPTEFLFSRENIGLICFSSSYECPLMWAHYAEKHKGVCLVFEVNKVNLYNVKYSTKLLRFDNSRNLGLGDAEKIASTKYYKWSYEREYRKFVKFDLAKFDEITKCYFESFSEDIKLVEVILGCKYDKEVLKEMLDYLVSQAELTNNFKITKKSIHNSKAPKC